MHTIWRTKNLYVEFQSVPGTETSRHSQFKTCYHFIHLISPIYREAGPHLYNSEAAQNFTIRLAQTSCEACFCAPCATEMSKAARLGKYSRSSIMRGTCSGLRKWEDMNINLLIQIFENLSVPELTSGASRVCSTWRLAARDPWLWRTFDLSMLKSNFIQIPVEPYVYVDNRSDKTMTRVLKIGLNLSGGNISTLILHYNLYVTDDHLTYTAERCPRLKHLVMPAWNRIKPMGICQAIRMWKDLESLTMPSISEPPYLVEEIARNCKKFAELKIMGPFDIFFASSLTEYLPNLKVLSLRCSMVFMDALIAILEGLKGLEVLNISHCVLVEACSISPHRVALKDLDRSILSKPGNLKKLLTCMSDSCVMCQRTRNDEGLMRWYKYEEDLWKDDEVGSLAV